MLLLPISPAKMRQDTDNPIICWLSSNFMVVQYQRSNIVCWRLHKLECFFFSEHEQNMKKNPWKPLQNHNKTWTCLRKPPNIEQIHTHIYIYIHMLNIDSRFPKQFISQWETQKSSANPRNLGSLSSLATPMLIATHWSYSFKPQNWLVVYLPLWKIWVCQLWWWNSQYMEK